MEAVNLAIGLTSLLLMAGALGGVYFAWLGHVHSEFERNYDIVFDRLRAWLLTVAKVTEEHMVQPLSLVQAQNPPFSVDVREYLRHGFADDVIRVFAEPPAPVSPSYYEPGDLVPQCAEHVHELTNAWRAFHGVDAGGGAWVREDSALRSEGVLLTALYSLHERSTLLLGNIDKHRQQVSAVRARYYWARHPLDSMRLRRDCQKAVEILREQQFRDFDLDRAHRLPGHWLG